MSTCAIVRSFIESKATEVQTSNIGFTSEVSNYPAVHTGPEDQWTRLKDGHPDVLFPCLAPVASSFSLLGSYQCTNLDNIVFICEEKIQRLLGTWWQRRSSDFSPSPYTCLSGWFPRSTDIGMTSHLCRLDLSPLRRLLCRIRISSHFSPSPFPSIVIPLLDHSGEVRTLSKIHPHHHKAYWLLFDTSLTVTVPIKARQFAAWSRICYLGGIAA